MPFVAKRMSVPPRAAFIPLGRGLSAEERAAPRMLFLMADIRALGRLPRLTPGRQDEYRVACRLREARRMGHLSADQLAELEEMAGTAD